MKTLLRTWILLLSAASCLAQGAAPNPFAEDKPGLSLKEALDLAVSRNQQVLITRTQLDLMRGRVREVRSEALPSLDLSSNLLRLRDPSFLNTSSFDTIPEDFRRALDPRGANLFDYSLKLTQPLYSAGKVRAALDLASLETEGVGIDRERAEQETRLNTFRAFYDLVLAEKLLDVNRQIVSQRESHLEAARTRRAAGVATEVDVLRSQVSLANAQPELLRAENGVRRSRAVLNNLLVRPVDFPTRALNELDFIPWKPAGLEAVVQEALQRRPELRRLRINEQESDVQTRLAASENRLHVDFNGEYGLSARDPANLVDANFSRWLLSVKITFPLYDGGKRDGLLQQAAASRRIAELTRGQQEEAVRLEAQTALDELTRADRTVETARLNVEEAERVLQMMESNYRFGAATTLDVVDAQAALTTSRWTLLQGMHDHILAKAQLRFIMGRDPSE